MKQLNVPMLLLATLVILMFTFVGISVAFRNVWLIILFMIGGFSFMGYGLYLKSRK